MQAIVIPLRVTGVAQANRQIMQLGRNLAQVRGGNINVAGGGAMQMLVPGRAQQARTPRQPRQPQTFQQRAMSALMTSRFGSGGLMPLVGKVAGLFGQFAGPVAVATTAVKALADITMQANENLRNFSAAMRTGGGNARDTAIGRALGDTTGELAREFSRNISQGGIAAGYAARAGISDPGGELFGPVDKTKNLLKWAEALRKMPTEQAIRAARATGTEELLKIKSLSEKTFRSLKATAELQGKVNSPDKLRAASEFNAQLDRTKMNMESLTNIIGDDFAKAATPLLKLANGLLEAVVKIGDSPIGQAILGLINPLGAIAGSAKGVEDVMKRKDDATKANTDALNELIATLRGGTFGGGDRARSAIPRQWSGYNADQWAKQALNLGAFSL